MQNSITTKKSLKIIVKGRVQGVSYRTTARRKASNFGIHGFVKNNQDGSVLIQAEGDTENLEQFVDWCRSGSYHAKVKACEVEEMDIQEYYDFRIIQ